MVSFTEIFTMWMANAAFYLTTTEALEGIVSKLRLERGYTVML